MNEQRSTLHLPSGDLAYVVISATDSHAATCAAAVPEPRCISCGGTIDNDALQDGLTRVVSGSKLCVRLAVTCPECPPPVLAFCVGVPVENAA